MNTPQAHGSELEIYHWYQVVLSNSGPSIYFTVCSFDCYVVDGLCKRSNSTWAWFPHRDVVVYVCFTWLLPLSHPNQLLTRSWVSFELINTSHTRDMRDEDTLAAHSGNIWTRSLQSEQDEQDCLQAIELKPLVLIPNHPMRISGRSGFIASIRAIVTVHVLEWIQLFGWKDSELPFRLVQSWQVNTILALQKTHRPPKLPQLALFGLSRADAKC